MGKMMKNKNWLLALLVVIFLGTMAFFMTMAMKGDSATTDETIHVLSGYEYWRGRFTVNPEHPPLGKQIATIGLDLLKPIMPINQRYEKAIKDYYYDSWAETREYSQKWLFKTVGNNAEQIVNSARTIVIIFTIILAIIMFFVARKWYGWLAALISVFLFAFSPVILTHGHLANTDLWMTLGFFISIFSFAYYLEKPHWWRLVLAAVCFALAILFKFSAVLLIPILVILWFVYRAKSQDRKNYSLKSFSILLLTFILISGFLIWADYGFPRHFAPPFVADPAFTYTNKPLRVLAPILTHLPVPEYFKGLVMVFATSVSERPAYLLGHFSAGGWWYYFPLAFLVKEPLPFILVLLSGLGCWIGWRKKLEFKDWLLVIPPAFYLLITLFTKLNIGIRHLMPIYPFLFIFAGYFISELFTRYKKSLITYYLLLITLAIMAVWYLSASICIYPYFMTYFNELAGGPRNGAAILVDSNIDWGQDMKRLANWLKENDITDQIKMEYYWASADQVDYYGVNYVGLKESDPTQRGWIVIGVSSLQRPVFSWLKNYTPVKIIGNSVYVYYLQ